jgi:hypothetical protein
MAEHTLEVGDALLLGGAIRLTVLRVEGDAVRLGITAPPGARVVAPEAKALRRAVITVGPRPAAARPPAVR